MMEAPNFLLCLLLTAYQANTIESWSRVTDDYSTHDPYAYSCWNSCGSHFGMCSCTYSCQDNGNCCYDYNSYCLMATDWPDTTGFPSCRYNCGHNLGSCSCNYNCYSYGNCCPDYDNYCFMTTEWPTTTDFPSCRYDCGHNLGSCSCAHDCWYYGNCCPDYDNYCFMTTEWPTTTDFPSCRYNCGHNLGSCSCNYNCYSYGNCCPDYDNYCLSTTEWPATTDFPSCRWNCGYDLSSCSCAYDCRYNGNCCPDYDNYCFMTTEWTTDDWWNTAEVSSEPCGDYLTNWMGEFSSPRYPNSYPNNARCTWTIHSTEGTTVLLTFTDVYLETCCDYIRVYDGPSTHSPLLDEIRDYKNKSYNSSNNDLTVFFYTDGSVSRRGFHANWVFVDNGSCKNKCGELLPTCGCDDRCQNHNDCCPDYDSYCSNTTEPTTWPTTVTHSCMHNCGYNFSSCSCTHDCQYYGNCCPDFHWYCPSYTTESHPQCGGHLYGSGLFSSPYYPNYYHDNAYCVWYLSAQQGQRIFLSFVDVQLERCCNCDYISVYDGSSTGYPLLGKICFNDTNNQVLHSSSRYLTVVFRSDYSGVSHGFKALFTSSLTANEGRVDCSSDNMVIVIQQSYLNSLGYSGNDLYVDDHLCRPTITSYEVVFSFALNTCGTAREMMNGYVSYTNNVRASQSQSGEITRQPQFLLHVGCRMEPDTIVQIFYKAKEIINANITGTGRFSASIAFYTSSNFYQQIYDFPYEVKLNQYLYVQVKLNRPDNSLDLFLDTCVASPNPNDFKDRSYDLLRNGCPRDNTYYSYTSGQHYYAQFSFRAFMFLRTHAYVYLQCKVIICPDNDYNSRCRQGCRYRRKRSLDSTYHTNTVTLGPIKLKGRRFDVESEKSKE